MTAVQNNPTTNYMNIKSLLAATAAAVLTASPALANSTFRNHLQLWKTVQSVGVTTRVNDVNLCGKESAGSYYPHMRILVVCQELGRPGGPEVDWTEGDFDTLRHEAHHIVQDCAAGRLGDQFMGNLFTSQQELASFVKGGLTERQIKSIIKTYEQKGVKGQALLLELEAFSAAASVSADTIAKKVTEFCSN